MFHSKEISLKLVPLHHQIFDQMENNRIWKTFECLILRLWKNFSSKRQLK